MRLDGIHHITCITADAQGTVDFYAGVLGLRMVKKTVNFDAPDVYHLYFGDERGSPGSILTFFEFPGAARGRPGAGMIDRLRWRVASSETLDFWADRLEAQGMEPARETATGTLAFADPEGLGLELVVTDSGDEPLRAATIDIPPEHALLGFDGVRALAQGSDREHELLTGGLGFRLQTPATYRLEGPSRHASYVLHEAPSAPGVQGAGTVHHIAWCVGDHEQEEWRTHLRGLGMHPTPIIDRQYFHSVYFREPRGVLFELATPSPGFDADEAPEHLGEGLRLPPQHEHLRARLEATLAPLANPRASMP